MQELLRNWKKSNSDLTKLQWVYVLVAVAILVAAGLIGLVNRELSDFLLNIVGFSLGISVVNFVAWSIIQNFVSEVPVRKRKN